MIGDRLQPRDDLTFLKNILYFKRSYIWKLQMADTDYKNTAIEQ